MGSDIKFEYHMVAKKMGVPNIILTGIEKEVRLEFQDDDEKMFACHVLMRLREIAKENNGDWLLCKLNHGDTPQEEGKSLESHNPCEIIDIEQIK